MSDDVWPLQEKVGSLYSRDGIGFGLKGHTRKDQRGRCFATRWFMFALLPVMPLQRYYVTEGRETRNGDLTTTHYVVHGQSHLRIDEIARTYAFCWLLAPAILLAPALVLLTFADQVAGAISVWALIALVIVLFIGGIFIDALLIMTYRTRWAPVRTVRWVKAPP